MTFINEISEVLKSTREASGVSLDEVSSDLNIPTLVLTQLEEGNIGAFKDIFELKNYLENYSKYLGLNNEEVIDEFNEYLFEKTSKIPMEKIEQAAIENSILEENSEKISSPYTRPAPKSNNLQFIVSIIVIIILVILTIVWSINQITNYIIY